MKSGVKRIFWLTVPIVIVGGSLLFWRSRKSAEDPVGVKTITVQKNNLVSSVIAPGKISSERIELIKASIEGIVKENIHLQEGCEIQKGDIIATVRRPDEELSTIQKDLEIAEIDLDLIHEQKTQAQELLAAKAISRKQLRELEIREYKQKITVTNFKGKLKEKPIVAPFSGMVVKKNFKRNQKVEAGTELVTIVDMNSLLAMLWVNEYDISKVQIGQKVELTGDTFSGPLHGNITSISRMAEDMTRRGMNTFTVISSIDNDEDGNLLLGSSVEARIILGEKQGIISVPLESVIYRDDKQVVFVVNDNMVRMRNVKTGISNKESVEITDGLEVGEIVVTRGNLDLKEGMKVRILSN